MATKEPTHPLIRDLRVEQKRLDTYERKVRDAKVRRRAILREISDDPDVTKAEAARTLGISKQAVESIITRPVR
jgi:predicted HTH transcriptional regulator